MVVGGSPPVRVGRCQAIILIIPCSSVVEHSTVNRFVIGSSPACGAIYGEVSEWPKEHDWKSCRRKTVSRVRIPCSPPLYIIIYIWPLGQAVKTPPFHGGNTGSNPLGVTNLITIIYNGGLAQLGEHLPYKQRVGGSIPSSSTIFT